MQFSMFSYKDGKKVEQNNDKNVEEYELITQFRLYRLQKLNSPRGKGEGNTTVVSLDGLACCFQ